MDTEEAGEDGSGAWSTVDLGDGEAVVHLRHGSVVVTVVHELSESWGVLGTFVGSGEALVLTELTVRPGPSPRGDELLTYVRSPSIGSAESVRPPGITTAVYRSVSLGPLISTAERALDLVVRSDLGHQPELADAADEVLTAVRQPGRAGRGDRYYAVIAQKYVESAGHRSRRRAIAAELGLRPEQVRDLVHEARRRGLLSPTAKGKQGGVLTPKGHAALRSPRGESSYVVPSAPPGTVKSRSTDEEGHYLRHYKDETVERVLGSKLHIERPDGSSDVVPLRRWSELTDAERSEVVAPIPPSRTSHRGADPAKGDP